MDVYVFCIVRMAGYGVASDLRQSLPNHHHELESRIVRKNKGAKTKTDQSYLLASRS